MARKKIALIGAGNIGGTLAHLCALKHLGALEVSTLLMVEPALNPIWSWWIHGEVPGAWILVGGGLILGATLLKSALDSRPELPVAT